MVNPTTQVFLIRHGEKPGAPDVEGDTPSKDLSIRGSARAAALPSLFTPDPTGSGKPGQQLSCTVTAGTAQQFGGTYNSPAGTEANGPRFPTPQHIVATKASKDSNRPIETVTPLAQALGKKIHAKHSDKDYQKAADKILSKYNGAVVLVCWHHGKIPEIAAALGVPPSQIDKALGGPGKKWSGTVFDRVWAIDWSTGSANLTVGFQQLLFGDETSS